MSRPTATNSSLHLALSLTTVAGFLDAYSYLDRGHVFANAQSANVVLFGIRASAGSWTAAAHYIPPVAAFAVGVAVAQLLQRRQDHGVLRSAARASISLELAVLVVIGFLPEQFPRPAVVSALSFVAGLQGTMFARLGRWSYNSILATFDLRTLALALYDTVADRDRGAASQAVTFALVVAAFALGAVTAGLLTAQLHARAIWAAAGLLADAYVLYSPGSVARQRSQPMSARPR